MSRNVRIPDLLTPLTTARQLHAWLRAHLEINVPRSPVCSSHHAPFEYIRSAYLEPARDLVVWAPRGGGKTRLAAAATLLDLLHKPPVSVRILGGSLDQSLRMWEHLVPDLERLVFEQMEKKRSARRITLSAGSTAAVLPQSQRAVRGLRVQTATRLSCSIPPSGRPPSSSPAACPPAAPPMAGADPAEKLSSARSKPSPPFTRPSA
jgi:hypothetical protein